MLFGRRAIFGVLSNNYTKDKIMQLVAPTSDIAFKKTFGDEKHPAPLRSLLNAVLKLEGDDCIENLTFLNPWQAPKLKDLKSTTLDVRVRDRKGAEYIVEMQAGSDPYFSERALYYASKAYSSQLQIGEGYRALKPVYFVGFLNFTQFHKDNKYLRDFVLADLEAEQNHHRIMTAFRFSFVELPKFKKELPELHQILEYWIYFLRHAHEMKTLPETLRGIPEIIEAADIADRHNWSEDELDALEFWQFEEQKLIRAQHEAEEERQRAEEERQRAEEERQRAEEERQRADEERRRKEAALDESRSTESWHAYQTHSKRNERTGSQKHLGSLDY